MAATIIHTNERFRRHEQKIAAMEPTSTSRSTAARAPAENAKSIQALRYRTTTSSPTVNFSVFAADPSRTAISSNPLLPIRATGSPGATSQ